MARLEATRTGGEALARALVTARLHGLHDTWPGLLVEAVTTDPACCLGELSSLTLTAVRALALDADWAEVLAALLVERKPTEAERQPDQRKQPFLIELDPAGAIIRSLACPQERTSPDPNAPGRLGFGWAPLSW